MLCIHALGLEPKRWDTNKESNQGEYDKHKAWVQGSYILSPQMQPCILYTVQFASSASIQYIMTDSMYLYMPRYAWLQHAAAFKSSFRMRSLYFSKLNSHVDLPPKDFSSWSISKASSKTFMVLGSLEYTNLIFWYVMGSTNGLITCPGKRETETKNHRA